MLKRHSLLIAALGFSVFASLPSVFAQTAPAMKLLEIREGVEKRLKPTSPQVMAVRSQSSTSPGIEVTIQPGSDSYPGVHIKPESAVWNLIAYGHIEASVVNTGQKPINLALRVDNAGDGSADTTNTESVSIAPGETKTVKVLFGYAYGYKRAYALKPASVVNLVLFTGKSEGVQSFRLLSVVAAGPAGEKPPVAPEAVRTIPERGLLLGAGARPLVAGQVAALQGAQPTLTATESGQSLQIVFPASGAASSVSVRPTVGRWDLRDFLEVSVRVRNTGQTPTTPKVRLESDGGASEWVSSAKPLAAGETGVILVPFAGSEALTLNKPETLTRINSDAVSGVTIAREPGAGESRLRIEAIQAEMPHTPMPAWLGKRPPVSGDWVKTLDEEFNGPTLDTKLWSISGENYWDKTSHWSRENVLLSNGVVKLRYQKKTGHNNDDPVQKPSDYASGYLHTYDRWAQRYGYFEARMKLPTAPGLWPAFWMMPDRGNRADPQGKRQDTANGGMEFDIMEHLTRWGRGRYNIAMHWDGYDKDHKSLGSDKVYVQPDQDGFITAGLLWTPGSVVYYCNGREVLRWDSPRISNVPEILMFTLPMGGWDNSPLEDARLPADFVIDYVRVWQRKDLASPADGRK